MFFSFFVESKVSDNFKNVFANGRENFIKILNNNFDIFSHAFQHESFWIQKPMVWISNDLLEINIDDISWIEQQYRNAKISNIHAKFDEKGELMIAQDFNGFFEIGSMKRWFLKIQIERTVRKARCVQTTYCEFAADNEVSYYCDNCRSLF